MGQIDSLDIFGAILILICTFAYLTKGSLWGKDDNVLSPSALKSLSESHGKTRCVVQRMDESKKNCIVFYGSQTGTAEDYASRLAKEGTARFGLRTMVANLEDYDFSNLNLLSSDKIVIFVLATYGEGDPTDNAQEFFEFITNEKITFENDDTIDNHPLSNLRYAAFGLGNHTYEKYNSVVKSVTNALDRMGAIRIGDIGLGDDGAGSMEDDYLAWKEPTWASIAKIMNLEERDVFYVPIYDVVERPNVKSDSKYVYLGEFNSFYLNKIRQISYSAHNPYIAPVTEAEELFNSPDRNCVRLQIDISESSLSYVTGDHVAIWPSNSGVEVDRFLRIFGLINKRNMVVEVSGLDPTAHVSFPSPTTYDSIARYYLEICAPVSRQFLSNLIPMSPTESIKSELTRLSDDKIYFQQKVNHNYLNLAKLLETLDNDVVWDKIPFSMLIEAFHKIVPRYYSISSSSKVHPTLVSITAVVKAPESTSPSPYPFFGVATNYFLTLERCKNENPVSDPYNLHYNLDGPRNLYSNFHVPVHFRSTNFKLPADSSIPIIMVGPGTGVAPFRGFMQEKQFQFETGLDIGKCILFYGCRRLDQDFLYKDEWANYKKILSDKFEYHVAMSRGSSRKQYVQEKIEECGAQVIDLIENDNAYFYVCGDAANMARAVQALLIRLFVKHRNISDSAAEDTVKSLRAKNRYLEDVWS